MPVVLIEDGAVAMVFRDVDTAEQAAEKYRLPVSSLISADHPPGTRHVGGRFVAPTAQARDTREPYPVAFTRAIARRLGLTDAEIDAELSKARQ